MRGLQGALFNALDTADTRAELKLGVLAAFQRVLDTYNKALTPDVYGEAVEEMDATFDLDSAPYRFAYCNVVAELRKQTALVFRRTLSKDVDYNEYNEWLTMWAAVFPLRCAGFEEASRMYPPIVPDIFRANIKQVGGGVCRCLQRQFHAVLPLSPCSLRTCLRGSRGGMKRCTHPCTGLSSKKCGPGTASCPCLENWSAPSDPLPVPTTSTGIKYFSST